ncbi:MAG TPA: agmatinase family protein [Methylomirabilota bacterium]|nr:agmatinase family protein [Methylomirabilota bacterium]
MEGDGSVRGRPGAATFLAAPLVGLDQVRPGTVVIGGAPHDSTHTSRFGTRMGPRGIREGSLAFARKLANAPDDGLVEVATGARLRPHRDSRLVDVGDFNVYPSDVTRTTEGIAGGVYEVVRRGGFSVCLGGDHYVGYPSCLGYCRAVQEVRPRARVGYIHIDGHLDFGDEVAAWGKYNHGTNARRISEIEIVSPANMVWIGIQGWVSEEQVRTIERNGARVFTALDVHARGPAEVARQAGERASAGCEYIYLSVDIDFIDTGFFPATGSVVNDAITPGMLLEILRVLSRYPVGAMDFVEVSPRIDPTGRSVIMSTELLLGMLGPRLFQVEL